MDEIQKIAGLLGLARRAGKAAAGTVPAENAIKGRKARFVIIAADASENTKKHFTDMCRYRSIPFMLCGTKEELGRCVGNGVTSILALTDPSFSEEIKKRLSG